MNWTFIADRRKCHWDCATFHECSHSLRRCTTCNHIARHSHFTRRVRGNEPCGSDCDEFHRSSIWIVVTRRRERDWNCSSCGSGHNKRPAEHYIGGHAHFTELGHNHIFNREHEQHERKCNL